MEGLRGDELLGMRVLVVDDEPETLEIVAHTLREAGATVLEASGAEAAPISREGVPPSFIAATWESWRAGGQYPMEICPMTTGFFKALESSSVISARWRSGFRTATKEMIPARKTMMRTMKGRRRFIDGSGGQPPAPTFLWDHFVQRIFNDAFGASTFELRDQFFHGFFFDHHFQRRPARFA